MKELMIKQALEVTNLQDELKNQIGAKKVKAAQRPETVGARRRKSKGSSKKIIVGSRNFNNNNEKNSTIGSSRPMTPISGKSQNLNPDLIIF